MLTGVSWLIRNHTDEHSQLMDHPSSTAPETNLGSSHSRSGASVRTSGPGIFHSELTKPHSLLLLESITYIYRFLM